MKDSKYRGDVFRAVGGKGNLKAFLPSQELRFLFYCRKIDEGGFLTPVWKCFRKIITNRTGLEIETKNIGEGLFLVHAFSITVNPNCVIGKNVNLHKGVTLGEENRGERAGFPTIGNRVWIGVNSTVVGNVRIGDNVLIAPNTFVNFDVPDDSIVIGHPAKIIRDKNATEAYINRVI